MHERTKDGGAARRNQATRRGRGRRVAQERPRRERRPQEKFARLIASATTVFADLGYGRASVQAICRAARVSVGTFYDHFDDKADVMLCVAEHATEEFAGPVFASMSEIEDHIRALIASPTAGVARAWLEASAAEPELRLAHARLRHANVERFADWIGEARAARRLRSGLDDASAARAVIGLLKESVGQTSEPAHDRIVEYAKAVWLVVYGEEATVRRR